MNLLATARSTCRALPKVGKRIRLLEPLSSRDVRPVLSTAAHLGPVKWLSTSTRLWRSWDVSFYCPLLSLTADVQNIIDDSHVASLRNAYPHIQTPTPAQEALLKALDSPKDIFLRDRMGRGK
jgi:hypothetical protein